MVYATAVRLLGNPAEAEDVSQTVFLRAFQRFDAIGSSPAAAGWLKTVTRNACLNHLSRYRARWRLFSELELPDGEDFGPAVEQTAEADDHRPSWKRLCAGCLITSVSRSCCSTSKTPATRRLPKRSACRWAR